MDDNSQDQIQVIPPYVSVEVSRNSKGYNWSAKAGHYPDPESALEAVKQAEQQLALQYGGRLEGQDK